MSDNNLRLQVILNAVDKLTRPFRSAQASSKELATALQTTRNSLKELNKQAGRIDEFRKTRSQLAITATNLSAAREEAAKLATQFAATNRPTDAQARLFSQAKNRVQELQQTYNGLLGSVQRQRQALKESGIDTKQLSSAQRELRKNADETRQAMERQQKSLKRLGEQQAKMNAAREQYSRRLEVRDRIAGAGATTTAAGLAMGAPVMAAVKSYSSMEDAMKGVAKQVNGLRDDNGNRTKQFYDMQDAIKAASEQLPMENGAIDYAALVEGGARMGVTKQDDPYEDQKRDLLAFASTAAKAATAFELPADELAESLGKVAQLYKVPTRNIEQLGDALNYLDDNAMSKGADIIDVLQRMGGVADRLDYRKAAALGSTLLTLGAAPEVAATAANAMVRKLSAATVQGKSFQEGVGILKLDPEKLEKQMTKDAMGTIQSVLEKVNSLPKDKRLGVMSLVFGNEFGDDAAKLANNLTELKRQLSLTAGDEANGSMQKESDINKDSLSAQWLLVKTGAQNAFSSLGETLRQPLMDIMDSVKSVTGALRGWIEANPQLAGTLMKVAAATAAITVALGMLVVAVAAVLGPIAVIRFGLSVLGVKTLPSVTAAVTRTGSALSWLAGAPLSLLRRGMASSGGSAGLLSAPLNSLRRSAGLAGNALKAVAGAPLVMLRAGMSGIRNVIGMVMNPLAALRGGLSAAGGVLRFLVSGPLALLRVALYGIFGLLGALLSPIGLVVAALAGVALVVWKYWQPISAFLGGVVEGFKAAAAPISAAFEPLRPVFQWIGDKVQALWGWFTDLLTPVKSTSEELNSAAAMGRRFGEALAEGLNMVMHPLESLKSGVSWLLEKLGIVSKEAAKAKLPEQVTRQQPATVNSDGKVVLPPGGFPSMGFAGMYDSGGTIPRGQFGIVGENGPEIVNGPANVTGRKRTAELARMAATLNPSQAEPASAKRRPESRIILPPDSVNGPANLPVNNRATELTKLAAKVSPSHDVTSSREQRAESRLMLLSEIANAPVKVPSRDRSVELAGIAAAVMPTQAVTEITAKRADPETLSQKVLASVIAGVMGVAAAPAEAAPLHPYSLPAMAYKQSQPAKSASVPPVIRYEINAPIHITAQPGQSAQDIAREVARQLDERERKARAKARSNFSDQGGYES
ncbi:TPA: phage tail tape measure protein [Enterobacter hormaechei]|uniref:phage tail tape measure protein n=3 Tax=Enterobacteriaceae TaxID=543 RepID=UPI002365BA1A|nr:MULTISPECIES: phage tail tape measure protein [Enterobacter cloacae complex]ELD3468791.1 phage tail tape measure protein [Enterobacter hormaechei]MDD7869389.1 phage tail tape measure protein [Enterobacter cloacae complex sp. 2022EL-00981]MED5732714.1 phage tail tape measure protein [Enterobacter hormaechei]HBM2510900.1 phage tail tape measure protein [Enterobacter hormaechei]HBM2520745.1 phage tail tape measure protein [Enterobacter hormaechei]